MSKFPKTPPPRKAELPGKNKFYNFDEIFMREVFKTATLTKVRISSFRLTALERPVGRVGPTEASVSTYKKRDLKKIKAEKNMTGRKISP